MKPGDLMTPELVAQRTRWVGDENARDHRAAIPLGQLLLAGRITEDQWLAGMTLAKIWRRWATMAGSPRRDAPAVGGAHPKRAEEEPLTPDEIRRAEDSWDYLDGRMRKALDAVRRVEHGQLAASMIESIAVDEVMPPRLQEGWIRRATYSDEIPPKAWQIGWLALQRGLTALAIALGITAAPKVVQAPAERGGHEAHFREIVAPEEVHVVVPYVVPEVGRDGRQVLSLAAQGNAANLDAVVIARLPDGTAVVQAVDGADARNLDGDPSPGA